jgi:hypothetical protein
MTTTTCTALVPTGIVTHCCGMHLPTGCCDPEDCTPCCPECPTCPAYDAWSPAWRRDAARQQRWVIAEGIAMHRAARRAMRAGHEARTWYRADATTGAQAWQQLHDDLTDLTGTPIYAELLAEHTHPAADQAAAEAEVA